MVPPGFSGLTLTGPLSALTTTGTLGACAIAEGERQRADATEQRHAAHHGCNQQAASPRRRAGLIGRIGGQRNLLRDSALEIEVDKAVVTGRCVGVRCIVYSSNVLLRAAKR